MAQYRLGTVTVTQGSVVVTGTGTQWTANNAIAANDMFEIAGQGVWYSIASVDSNTQITLTSQFAAATQTNVAYAVQTDFTPINHFPLPSYGDVDSASLVSQTLLQIEAQLVTLSTTAQTVQGDLEVSGSLIITGANISGLSITDVGYNGITIDNSPIGATTPSTGAFTTVTANSPLNLKAQRRAVSDANATLNDLHTTIAMTTITVPRIITLPAATAFSPGVPLTIVDESGACSAVYTITIAAAGSDKINGAASAVISVANGYLTLESNGTNGWTVVGQTVGSLAAQITAYLNAIPTVKPTVTGQWWINGGILQVT